MRVLVTGIAGAPALNTVSVLDTLTKAETAWRFLRAPAAADPLFDVAAVGVDDRPIGFANGVSATPGAVADRVRTPDLVVVPGLDDDVLASLERNLHWEPWLTRWADEGAIVATSCTGAFLAAEAGLLRDRQATTHWVAEGLFRTRYPDVELLIDRLVVDVGDVVTSGGATTAFNLVLYLVSRFGSAERAHAAAQMLLLDAGRRSQLPFAVLGSHRVHDDPLVRDAQSLVDRLGPTPISVGELARRLHVSPRTLGRRFTAALGVGPRAYIEEVRVEAAKRLLLETASPVDRIRTDVGFRDASAFRRAFKRRVGLTPSGYRRRLGGGPRPADGRSDQAPARAAPAATR